jgi:cation-transporting P-type ATPase C
MVYAKSANLRITMSKIIIKSEIANRVRLKSDIFATKKNIEIIQKEIGSSFASFRANISCKSIIFTYQDTTLTEIIKKLNFIFKNRVSKVSVAASNAISSCSGGSCSSCSVKKHTKKSFRRKLIEFGALSLYAVYMFVSETIFGVAVATAPLIAISVIAAIPLLQESYEDIKAKKFTLHTFMSATLALALFFEPGAAFEIIYILRGGMLLEEYIANKSRDEIKNLVSLDIKEVYVKNGDVEILTPVNNLKLGDIVVATNGEKIPVDGTIIEGSAEIDEAIINGRSEPEYKSVGDTLYAGTICQKGRVYIKVEALGNSTYISRTMKEVERSLAFKSPSELEADKLANRLLKLGTLLTVGTLLVTGSFVSAFSVMIVMSCPCATVLAASTAISGGIANAAKAGVLIKGGDALENVSRADVFCFDKTGTLTTGRPMVKHIITSDGISKNELIKYAAIAEYRNSHPIAKAIVDYAKGINIDSSECALSNIIPGYGVEATIDGSLVIVGNEKFMNEQNVDISSFIDEAHEMLQKGQTVVYVAKDFEILGMLSFEHEVREGTHKMIKALRAKGVKHIALLTGDDERVADEFAKQFGFDSIYSNATPEQKAEAIDELKSRYNKVVMVGDGVNDTYAMSKADVAISFAAGGSEAAIAVSDIAITHSHPEDVVYLYELSKKSLNIVNQNYYIGTGTNLIGVALAAVGRLSPVGAGMIHIGHTAGIMANSYRLSLAKVDNNY